MGNTQRFRWLILLVSVCFHFPVNGQIDRLIDCVLEQSGDARCEEMQNSLPLNSKTNPNTPLGSRALAIRKKTYTNKSSIVNIKNKGLWLLFEGREFLYQNRKLYLPLSCDSNELEEFKPNRESKVLKKSVEALVKLEKRSSYAQNIIQTLQKSENKFILDLRNRGLSYMLVPLPGGKWGAINNNAYAFQALEAKQSLVDYAPFDQIGSGAQIRWHPSQGVLNLAHELSHAYDANFGLLDDRLIDVSGEAMVAREIRALYHENTIRMQMKKSLREDTNYGHAWMANDQPFTYPLPFLARH